MPTAPYISMVVAARNDNHGGNMLRRRHACLDSWMFQAQRYDLPSEIVVVEWNSPEGARKLKDDLRWPQSTSPCEVRFVEVSREIHRSIPYPDAIPLHQMISKNVGIRRARGQFVLSTNLDIIFSAELMEFLAARKLESRALYRIDRYDVANNLPAEGGVDGLLAFCGNHITKVSAREGTWDTQGDRIRPVEKQDILEPDCGIRLAEGWYGVEFEDGEPNRYLAPEAEILFERPPGVAPYMILDVEVGPSANDGWVQLDVHDCPGAKVASAIVDARYQLCLTMPPELTSGKVSLTVANGGFPLVHDMRMLNLRVFGIRWSETRGPGGPWHLEVAGRRAGKDWRNHPYTENPWAASMSNATYLHTNGCGDFAMMSRDAWFDLRGYPEFPIWPMHIDALFEYSAYHAGFPEIILRDPLRIFHIEHASAAGATPEGVPELYARIAKKGVPIMEYDDVMKVLVHMRRFNVPIVFSDGNWGMGDRNLPETTL